MAAILKRLFGLLNSDLTGRSWEKEVPHAYFQQLVYFGHKDPSRCYWEAELPIPGEVGRTAVVIEGTAGPGPAEEAFCRATLCDLDQVFQKCRHVFEPEFASLVRQPFPSDWRKVFKLDGFSVPPGGDVNGAWQVTYSVEPAGRFFTAHFESGKVQRLEVDG
jgi:hypothetical protein